VLDFVVVGSAQGKIGNPLPIAADGSQPAPVTMAAMPQGGGGAMELEGGGYGQSPSAAASAAAAAAPSAPYGGSGAGGRGPTVSAGGNANVVPISALTPFNQRWTIRARVTAKGDVRTWNNARGTGKLFSVTVVDAASTEIRATIFQEGVARFFDLLTVGRIYLFSNGKVKTANTQYTSVKNEYEISFAEKAIVVECAEDAAIAKVVHNFVKIGKIADVEPGRLIDTIGVLSSVAEPASLISKKTQQELMKRDTTLVDETGASVTFTLWGDKTGLAIKVRARACGAARAHVAAADALSHRCAPPPSPSPSINLPQAGDVLALKGVKVADYGGRSLSCFGSSGVEVNPDIPQARALAAWWPTAQGSNFTALTTDSRGGGGGGDGPTTVVETRFCVSNLKSDAAAGNDGPIHMVKATLFSIKYDDPSRLWYPACNQNNEASRPCQKKLTENDGVWTCPKGCLNPAPNYRYIANATIVDWSGQEYATLFDAEATEVLGIDGNALHALVERAGDIASLPQDALQYFHKALFKEYLFTTKAKQEERNGEVRVQVSVVKVRQIDPAKESKALINSLQRYISMGV